MARVLYSGVNENGQPSEVMLGCAIGDIIPHFGTTAPPGTLVCDGSEVSREAYAELYEEIGSLCGQGDGSTTFNLPDLRGRWMMGADATHDVGSDIAEGLPDIKGGLNTLSGSSAWLIRAASGAFSKTDNEHTGGETGSELQSTQQGDNTNSVYFSAQSYNAIYGASAHVTPASVAVLPCIVYE